MVFTPPTSHPTGTPVAYRALQLGVLRWGFHHCQDLGVKCRVCSRPLLQDLGGRQRWLAYRWLGTSLAWGSQSLARGERQQERFKLDS